MRIALAISVLGFGALGGAAVFARAQTAPEPAVLRTAIAASAIADLAGAQARANLHLQEAPDDAAAHLLAGNLALDADDRERARALFLRANALAPFASEGESSSLLAAGYTGLGILARRDNRLDLARSHYRFALFHTPRDPQALSSLAVLEALEGHAEIAQDLAQRARALSPTDPGLVINHAVALHVNGRWRDRDRAVAEAKRLGFDQGAALSAWFEKDWIRTEIRGEDAF